ncbi:MAG: lamin tail domain-containing protein, partial [Planctomycetes bacterium]|nr:lamin tail domain-containing protein [Planctomycetota bacterium]
GLSEHGEDVYLTSGAGGVLTGEYSTEQENFGAAENGVTLGMYIKTDGSDDFVRLLTVTKGYANNNDPIIGPVVISEIMYNPQAPDSDAEYIELTNLTGGTVYLYDPANPANTWRIKGVSYAFPPGVTLSANETILVTRGDPAAFRSTYGISAGIDIYGPYPGALDNGGEKVTLIQPGEPDPITFEVPEIRIDRVNYSDGSHPVGDDPWPTTPDGGGKSLTRKVLADYGNDLANWQADDPSPGQ